MESIANAAKLANWLEQKHVFEFVVSLNSEIDQIRSHVLGKDLFPSLHQAFSIVRLEESKLGVMMKTSFASSTEIFAFEYHG